MKIAFASTDGKTINQKFGETRNFQIWEINPDQAAHCGSIGAIDSGHYRNDNITARASAIIGCSIVCSVDIGTRDLAKIVARNAFHLKTGTEVPITEIVERLQGVLRNNPPPWMRKAMGIGPAGSLQPPPERRYCA